MAPTNTELDNRCIRTLVKLLYNCSQASAWCVYHHTSPDESAARLLEPTDDPLWLQTRHIPRSYWEHECVQPVIKRWIEAMCEPQSRGFTLSDSQRHVLAVHSHRSWQVVLNALRKDLGDTSDQEGVLLEQASKAHSSAWFSEQLRYARLQHLHQFYAEIYRLSFQRFPGTTYLGLSILKAANLIEVLPRLVLYHDLLVFWERFLSHQVRDAIQSSA